MGHDLPERSEPAAQPRDRFIDLLRVTGILVVVAGHWLVLVPYVRGGLAGGRPLYQVDPGFWPLTWIFNVLPLFFFAGGFANFTSLTSGSAAHRRGFLARRLRRLLLPTLAFGAAWALLELLMHALQLGSPGLLRGLRLGQITPFEPLWFLGVYLGVILLSPATAALHRRFGWAVPAGLLAGTCLVDLSAWRTGFSWLLLANLAFVWLLPHQLGYLYADGRLQRIPTRALWVVAGCGLALTAALTSLPFYTRNLLDGGVAVLGVAAPTVPFALLVTWMLAAALAARPALEGWLARERVWNVVRSANDVAMTLFLWHMTAYFAVLVAVAGLGLPLPSQADAVWWLERPVFVVLPLAALVPLVRTFARLERAGRGPRVRERAAIASPRFP